jgi:GNAT superfamily N-acetyltransferase
MLKIDRLKSEDLKRVHEIQQAVYPAIFHEQVDVFKERLRIFSEGCLGAWDKEQLIGYVFSHPWILNQEVALHKTALNLPIQANCLYLHDMAIDPHYRGLGIGSQLWNSIQLKAKAMNLYSVALVAVLGAETFWERCGFVTVNSFPYINEFIGVYMIYHLK